MARCLGLHPALCILPEETSAQSQEEGPGCAVDSLDTLVCRNVSPWMPSNMYSVVGPPPQPTSRRARHSSKDLVNISNAPPGFRSPVHGPLEQGHSNRKQDSAEHCEDDDIGDYRLGPRTQHHDLPHRARSVSERQEVRQGLHE